MIETIIMTLSLVILGYAFYISSNLFWIHKDDKNYFRWIYSMLMIFIICSYFLFSFVLFAFITQAFKSQSFASTVNIVLSIFLFSGAGLLGVIMKYYIGLLKTSIINNIRVEVQKHAAMKKGAERGKDREMLLREIERLTKELEKQNKIEKVGINKEIRIMVAKKELDRIRNNKHDEKGNNA
jgi:hypothetical protein